MSLGCLNLELWTERSDVPGSHTWGPWFHRAAGRPSIKWQRVQDSTTMCSQLAGSVTLWHGGSAPTHRPTFCFSQTHRANFWFKILKQKIYILQPSRRGWCFGLTVNSDLFLCEFIYLFLFIHVWSGHLISNTLNILRSITHFYRPFMYVFAGGSQDSNYTNNWCGTICPQGFRGGPLICTDNTGDSIFVCFVISI